MEKSEQVRGNYSSFNTLPAVKYTWRRTTTILEDTEWPFQKLLEEHRTVRQHNERATGITEDYGEREQLLYDLLLEVDEHEEKIRERNKDKTALEER